MVRRSEISEQLAMYLNGRADLDSFEDWIVQRTWNIHRQNDPDAEDLAFAIEESLAEHSSGHISEAALKDELKAILYGDTPSRNTAYLGTSDYFVTADGASSTRAGDSTQAFRWKVLSV